MKDWINLRDELPSAGLRVRLKLRDGAGEYEGPSVCAMDLDGEFWNVDADPPVMISPRVVAWRAIEAKPRPGWARFAGVIKGGSG